MPKAAHATTSDSSFRFNARNVFLTYPQCGGTTSEDLLAHFKTFIPPISYGLVSRELHADGSPHLHALFGWSKKYSTRDPRSFDFRNLHPNVQSPRVLSDVAAYVRKDGSFVEFGPVPTAGGGGADKWRSIADATQFTDFMNLAKELAPKVLIYILV